MATRISICIERAAPLVGYASREPYGDAGAGDNQRAFEGWLGLLRVLSEFLPVEHEDRR